MEERIIKFRGKRCDNGQWVYGHYVESHYSWKGYHPHKSWILDDAKTNGGFFALQGKRAVLDNSVGQFTGLHDKNGKEIYEGDIIKHPYVDPIFRDLVEPKEGDGVTSEVVFHDGAFVVKYDENDFIYLDGFTRHGYVEVIGNIHENSELVKYKQ